MEEEAVLFHYGRECFPSACNADDVRLGFLHGSDLASLLNEFVEHLSELDLGPSCRLLCLVLLRDEVFVKGLVEEVDGTVAVVNADVLKRHSHVHPFVLASAESVPSPG